MRHITNSARLPVINRLLEAHKFILEQEAKISSMSMYIKDLRRVIAKLEGTCDVDRVINDTLDLLDELNLAEMQAGLRRGE